MNLNYAVSRCKKMTVRLGNHLSKLQTIEIGTRKSQIMARLYDKPLEIRERSNKDWMFDVWKLNTVPEGTRIIRCEYQLKREAIKDLGYTSKYL